MLRVCSTRPVHGAAKYNSRWRAVFQRERGDAAFGRDPQVVEHAAEPAGPSSPVAVRRALSAGAGGGDDLFVAEVLLCPVEQMWYRQWNVLHEPLHEART